MEESTAQQQPSVRCLASHALFVRSHSGQEASRPKHEPIPTMGCARPGRLWPSAQGTRLAGWTGAGHACKLWLLSRQLSERMRYDTGCGLAGLAPGRPGLGVMRGNANGWDEGQGQMGGLGRMGGRTSEASPQPAPRAVGAGTLRSGKCDADAAHMVCGRDRDIYEYA